MGSCQCSSEGSLQKKTDKRRHTATGTRQTRRDSAKQALWKFTRLCACDQQGYPDIVLSPLLHVTTHLEARALAPRRFLLCTRATVPRAWGVPPRLRSLDGGGHVANSVVRVHVVRTQAKNRPGAYPSYAEGGRSTKRQGDG